MSVQLTQKILRHTAKRAQSSPAAMLQAWRADGTLGEKVRHLRVYPTALVALLGASEAKAERAMILEEFEDVGGMLLT